MTIYALHNDTTRVEMRDLLDQCADLTILHPDHIDDLRDKTTPINVKCLAFFETHIREFHASPHDLIVALLAFETMRDLDDYETLHDCRDLTDLPMSTILAVCLRKSTTRRRRRKGSSKKGTGK